MPREHQVDICMLVLLCVINLQGSHRSRSIRPDKVEDEELVISLLMIKLLNLGLGQHPGHTGGRVRFCVCFENGRSAFPC